MLPSLIEPSGLGGSGFQGFRIRSREKKNPVGRSTVQLFVRLKDPIRCLPLKGFHLGDKEPLQFREHLEAQKREGGGYRHVVARPVGFHLALKPNRTHDRFTPLCGGQEHWEPSYTRPEPGLAWMEVVN